MAGDARRRPRLLVAEDPCLRGALAALLEGHGDAEVVAEVTTGRAVLPAAVEHRPDVALLDIDLLGVDGLSVVEELHRRLPRCAITIITGVVRPDHLRRAIAANVSGFIVKEAPAKELLDAIGQASAGGRVIDPRLAVAALEGRPNPLSPREAGILRRYAAGHEVREIAVELFLANGTVRNYLASATAKLGAHSRAHAVRIAAESGWL
ncbi:response regulator transcription factor [Actinoallomurus acaciae]|uniref:DNA-binding response regulator n=1 Tax=Actinoallomurus acaciae TaxID=502577 RepID=A0ABV5YIW8_9ACTN